MRLRGILMLLGAAFFWGTTFVAQITGMEDLGPFSYAASRFFLGFLSLLVVLFLFRKQKRREAGTSSYRSGWKAGLCAGGIMFVASSLQQISMLYTTAGKAAFITCLYIIFVPLFAFFLHSRIRPENWAGALLALVGLFLLAVKGDFSLGLGDSIVLVSAIFWAFHILFIGHFAGEVDVMELSVSQVGLVTVLSAIVAFAIESPTWSAIVSSGTAIIYGGIMSAGVAFTLQAMGQKYADPAHAAILMSFEAIFGALASWLILGEVMTGKEIFGCFLMITGMTVTQLGEFFHRKKFHSLR